MIKYILIIMVVLQSHFLLLLDAPPAPSYKVYSALLSQSGTSNPTATVLENTIGNIVWARADIGRYSGTLTGAFTADKTFILTNGGWKSGVYGGWLYFETAYNDSVVSLQQDASNLSPQDGFSKQEIEIRVYP